MMIWLVPVALIYFVLLGFYIKEDLYGTFERATKLKMTLSSLFCAVGIAGAILWVLGLPPAPVGTPLMICGLVCALVGDYFLRFIVRDAKKFNCGILFFAGAQAFFLSAMFLKAGIGFWEFIVLAVLLLAALILMKKQNWQLRQAQTPLTVYMVLLSLMMAKALTMVFIPPNAPPEYPYPIGPGFLSYVLMAAGAVLFWISDLLLGIWNYHSRKNAINAGNSITYFTGTFLIALSLFPIFAA